MAGGQGDGAPINYPDRIYRAKRERPLLVIHPLQMLTPERTPLHEQPVMAWSISFPQTSLPEKRVEFVVTTTWLRENSQEDLDDDDPEIEDV
jgi:hypothetical protein